GSASQVIEAVGAAMGVAIPLETPATRLGHAHSARVTGRDRELQRLHELYRAVRGGDTACAMIIGPPGIGKTALVRELRVHAQLDGAVVGHAELGEGAPTYAPVEALVAQLHGARPAAPAAAGARPEAEGADEARSRLTEETLGAITGAA